MKKTNVFLCCLLIAGMVYAQTKPEKALKTLEEKYPTEKVFLQYNKEFYIAGETIWFKSYVFTGYSLTDISTNLYVELYNQKKQLLNKSIIPLISGVGDGSFALPPQMSEGIYYIRAYTKWMLNFSNGSDYVHSFLVYNPVSPMKIAPRPVQWTAVAFPESGTLLADVENKIAVRLFSKGNLPSFWKGTVFEEKNPSKAIASFRSFNTEVGEFTLSPKNNVSYHISITDNLGNTQTIALPQAKSSGALIRIKHQDDVIVCNLEFKNLIYQGNYLLIGSINNQLAYKAYVKRTDTTITARIPLKQLITGILHLTLFNEQEQPVAERLVFVHQREVERPAIEFDTVSTNKRSNNYWRFIADSNATATYTVMVSNATAIAPKESLPSALWLSNDITWPLDNPSWYFNEENEQRKKALDALLITEKWRWFSWTNVLNGHYPFVEFRPDNYLSFTGTVFSRKKLQLNQSLNLIYQLPDSSLNFQQLETDSTGSFTIDGALFQDSVTVFYQLNTKKEKADRIKIDFELNNKFSKMTTPFPLSNYTIVPRNEKDKLPTLIRDDYTALQNQASLYRTSKQMEEVIIRTKKKDAKAELNKKLSSGMFRSINEDVFDFVNVPQDLRGTTNIFQWLSNRVSGLSLFYINGQRVPVIRGKVAAIYLDEAPSNVHWISSVPITDIAMVKVQRDFMGAAGAILIYTKQGKYNNNTGHPFMGLPYSVLTGYKRVPNPFSIDYQNELHQQIDNDSRNSLFWSSQVTVDSSSNATIKFYNSDLVKQFKLTITGFKSNGHPVYAQYLIPLEN